MRTIKKRGGDRTLNNRNNNPPTTPDQATSAWNNFRSKCKTASVCYAEQYGLCGYSETSIDNKYPVLDENSQEISKYLGAHIEHIEPKSKAPSRTFEHDNLLLSAIDTVKERGVLKRDIFGGHRKLRSYSETSFVSPLWSNCRDYFHFETSTGRVVPSSNLPSRREQAKARLTIYILNLNAPYLVNLRRTWLQELDKLILAATTRQEIQDLAELELSPLNGTLRPFHSAQRQLLGTIGAQICQQHGI